MSEHVEHIRQVNNGHVAQTTRVIEDTDPELEGAHEQNVAVRVVWYIAGVLLVLLAFRFVLVLLGANPANGFTNFIYTISHPFVAPFFGVFSYNLHYGVSRFETFTLLAMAVYALIAYGIAHLLMINRHD
jgi:hypothetical protein